MNEFKNYHPVVNFTYFLFAIGFGMFFMHPVCLFISLFSAFLYSVTLKGARGMRSNLCFVIPLFIAAAIINPAFNHEGMTILWYFPNGNPLTLESILYGIASAAMLSAVILWFSCFNEIMTEDKFIYLFGKIAPSLSLVISMTLRFIPKFRQQFKDTADARKCLGCDISKGSLISRIKNAVLIFSIMITRSLENGIDTADSMKSRGYGLPGRTAFSNFRFSKRDAGALLICLVAAVYVFIGKINGALYFSYFPSVRGAGTTPYSISVFISYLFLCIYPVLIEVYEVKRWKASRSKI